MKFSIILPAFNAGKTIQYALNSLQMQIYTDFEVIIIDDGSTDNTADVCKAFSSTDSRFKYFYQCNLGVSIARNNGISYSNGDYIAFLDSDDAYHSEYLASFAELIENHPDIDNFWCQHKSVKCNVKCDLKYEYPQNQVVTLSRNDLLHIHQTIPMGVLWNKVYRASIIKEYNIIMPIDLSLGEDQIFNLKYLDKADSRIVATDRPLYFYTQNENGSLDTKYRPDLLEIYNRLNNTLLFYLQKWNVSEREIKLYNNCVFFCMEKVLYNTYHSDSPLTKREKYRYNKKILKSDKFKNALKSTNCHINKFYKFAYKLSSWRLIQLFDQLVKIKGKIV